MKTADLAAEIVQKQLIQQPKTVLKTAANNSIQFWLVWNQFFAIWDAILRKFDFFSHKFEMHLINFGGGLQRIVHDSNAWVDFKLWCTDL